MYSDTDTFTIKLLNKVINVSQSADTPTWEGWQSDILEYFGITSSAITMTDAVWEGDVYTKYDEETATDINVRNATFNAQIYTADYKATYYAEGKSIGYKTTTFYRMAVDDLSEEVQAKLTDDDVTTVYKVKITVKYVEAEG